jgi:hypothetical protein
VGISIAFFGQSDFDGDGIPDSEDACPDTPSGVEVDLTGCPPDSDGDGIPDYLDKCNGTPSGVKVDDTGCPIDSDKDGVPDYMDDCPHSPAGASVDAHGCVIDSDKDGVPDDKDNCPDTSPGVSVDARGCPKDSVSYENPDTLQKEEEETIPETEELNYNLNDEHLVKNMIFTDGKLYTVQISSWRIRSKAESEAEKLRGKGYNAFVNEFFIEKLNQNWFQVRVGYLKTLREAQELAEKLR